MKILILGSKGQVGSEIANTLINRFKQKYTKDLKIYELSRHDVDLCDLEKLKIILFKKSPNIIINAAAYTNVDKAETENVDALKINSKLPGFLGKICKELNTILIHFSTDYVFDGLSSEPYAEQDSVNPINFYGYSKLEGENSIRNSCNRYIILRTAWVFGKQGNNFVKTMIKLGKLSQNVKVVSDQVGSPTSSSSIAKAVSEIIYTMKDADENDYRWGTYHFCGLPYASWASFAQEIFRLAIDKKIISHDINIEKIKSRDFKSIAKRPNFSKLNCNKISNHFNRKPNDWKKSLDKLMHYLEAENV